jgi:hypothetical protein
MFELLLLWHVVIDSEAVNNLHPVMYLADKNVTDFLYFLHIQFIQWTHYMDVLLVSVIMFHLPQCLMVFGEI